MSGLEWNKIAASVLLAGLLAMVVGSVADILYRPVTTSSHRGYQVEVPEVQAQASTASKGPEIFPIGSLLAAGDAGAGAAVFKRCATCHMVNKGAPHGIGPNLWSVIGQAKGHWTDYSYSSAMKAAGGKWDYAELFLFLHNPKRYMPGTKMSFAGLSKPKDIADVIAYLRQHHEAAPALPAVDAVLPVTP
jgi:cytochrome c